jgi:hypothetical protein
LERGCSTSLQTWADVAIPGKALTRYGVERRQGVLAWRAEADHSASMWRLRLSPSLSGDPLQHLEFSWWVDRLVPGAELQTAGMGDSPARLVLAFDGDQSQLSLKNRMLMDLAQTLTGEPTPYATLIYVWANKLAPETLVIHPRTDRVRKIVVEQGEAGLHQWRHYQRNVAKDFERAFGEAPGALTAIAWMADADNMAATALTWFGDIRFGGLAPMGPVTACRQGVVVNP